MGSESLPRPADLDVTVVMACYSEDRWHSIVAALESIRAQRLQPREVIVGVDNNQGLAARLAAEFDWIVVVTNDDQRGASATRNRACEYATMPFIAFLDDDETAAPDWLAQLVRPFSDPSVVGTGGRYRDHWLVDKPDWFPAEFAWVVGGAYEGMPTVTTEVRNVWSGNMAVRTAPFAAVDGFRTDFGKRGEASQPEDTDLCIRLAQHSNGRWMYVPSAIIDHAVPAARASLGFFVRRCYSEGAGKASMSGNFASSDVIDTERSYALQTARRAAVLLTKPARAQMLQGLAIILGLTCAAAGYGITSIVGVLAKTRSEPEEPQPARAVTDSPAPRGLRNGAA